MKFITNAATETSPPPGPLPRGRAGRGGKATHVAVFVKRTQANGDSGNAAKGGGIGIPTSRNVAPYLTHLAVRVERFTKFL